MGFRQGMSQDQMTVPDISWHYEERENDMDRYRTGGKRMAPPVILLMFTSYQDSWSEEAENRAAERKIEVWGINSDSKKTLANEELTGNRPLPTTHRNYHIIWRQIMEWRQRFRRGWYASRNWLMVEFASGNWDADAGAAIAARAGAVERFHPVPNLKIDYPEDLPGGGPNARCGSRVGRRQGAAESPREHSRPKISMVLRCDMQRQRARLKF